MGTIHVRGPISHNQIADEVSLTNINGETRISYKSNRFPVNSTTNDVETHLIVRSINRSEIEISGSFSQFLRGHNIYCYTNIQQLVLTVFKKVAKALNIKPTPKELKEWESGNIKIIRIDLVGSIQCENGAEKRLVLNKMHEFIDNKWHDVRRIGFVETIVLNGSSRNITIKAYDKMAEIRKKHSKIAAIMKLYGHLSNINQILAHIDSLVRIELSLRSPWLKRNNLNTLNQWNKGTAARLLRKILKKITPNGEIRSPNEIEMDKTERAQYRTVYALYLAGTDLRDFFSPRTLRNHRKYFMEKHQFDILIMPDIVPTAKKLSEILATKALIMKQPDLLAIKKS